MSTPQHPLPPAVAQALANGRVIDAIKLLRQQPGLGLREAKEMVEAAVAHRATQQAGATAQHTAASAPSVLPTSAPDPLADLNGRAPGEVPPASDWTLWALAAALIALVALLLRR
jgi:hypothetical protein